VKSAYILVCKLSVESNKIVGMMNRRFTMEQVVRGSSAKRD